MTPDSLEAAWARHLEVLALMAAPGADIDVDPLALGERIEPEPLPQCVDCRSPVIVARGRCASCRARWERANPEQVAAERRAREQALADRRQRVAALRAQGLSLAAIAAEVKVTRATVIADLRRAP